MSVELGNLKPGQWRYLTQAEMDEINTSVAGSSKTANESKSENKSENKNENKSEKVVRVKKTYNDLKK
jgi:hypothetical protein